MSRTSVSGRVIKSTRCGRPNFIPKPRLRGTKALGLSFEKKLGKALPKHAIHNQWFSYIDSSGKRYCCLDWLLFYSKVAIVLESKLTRISDAKSQLLDLYLPVVSAATARTIVPIIVVKSLSRWNGHDRIFTSLLPAVKYYLETKEIPIIHYLGVGKL